MKLRTRCRNFHRDESGGVAVITGICLIFLIGFVALVVDVGHLQAVRNEVQNAADAAALAGARALFPFSGYPDASLVPKPDPPYCDLAATTARNAAAENRADTNLSLATAAGDVETGIWDFDTRKFTPNTGCDTNTNAVRVTIRKDNTANQPVNMWFARILGIDTMPVKAQAVAAVGFLKKTTGSFLPVWIPQHIYDDWQANQQQTVIAYPDTGDDFAWCAPDPQSASASYLKDAINGGGAVTSPEMDGTVNLNNGLLGSVHNAISQQITQAGNESYYYHTAADSSLYVDHDSANAVDASGTPTASPISYPTDYIDPAKAGKPVTGWLTFLLVGERVDSDGNVIPYDPNNPDAVKMTQQGNIDSFMPVIVTDVLKPSAKNNNQWAIEFYKLSGGTKFMATGGETGNVKSQIYATLPKLVR